MVVQQNSKSESLKDWNIKTKNITHSKYSTEVPLYSLNTTNMYPVRRPARIFSSESDTDGLCVVLQHVYLRDDYASVSKDRVTAFDTRVFLATKSNSDLETWNLWKVMLMFSHKAKLAVLRREKRRNWAWERVCRSKIPRQAASRDSGGEWVRFVARSPASQPASHRGTWLSPLLWPSILFLLLSSLPSHPLSLMCATEKDVCRSVRDFSGLRLYAPVRAFHARMCVGEENKRETERTGWDGNFCGHNAQSAIGCLS